MTEATTPAPATNKESPPTGPVLPPEEGVQGWLCVVGSFLALFSTFGFLNSIGVFQTTYQETTLSSYTSSEISWIFAVQICLLWALGPLYGRLIDTYGPAPVIYPCTFLCIFSLCMTSLADKYYQIFLAQGLVYGLGVGGIFTAAMVCVSQWFVRRRGLAIGIATSGSSLGGVIFPIFINRMIENVGFYGAVRYTALFVGVLLVASCLMVRGRLPKKPWNNKTPWFDVTLFKDKPFAFYSVGSFLVMWGFWGPYDFISSMAQAKGFSPTLAFYLISIMNSTSIPGRIIPPHLADRFGHFNVITICCTLIGVSMLALWLPFNYHPSHAGIIVFGLVYGFVSGSFISLLMPCVAKAGSLETLGQRFGTFQIVMGLACLTGLPIMGAILNRQSGIDFSGLQIFVSVSVLLGAGFLAVSTYLLSRVRGTWKI